MDPLASAYMFTGGNNGDAQSAQNKAPTVVNGANARNCDAETTPLNKTIDLGKRKKSRSSNSSSKAVPPSPPTIPGRPVGHRDLDVWLENCLRDAGNAPLTSSSSEFLDTGGYPHPQSQQQQQQQASSGHNNTFVSQPQRHMHSQSNNMKPNGLPPSNGSMPSDTFNFQKYFPTYQYPAHPNFGGNGSGGPMPVNYINGRPNYYNHMNADFASLPPAVNMPNHSKDLRIESQDILDGLEQRRFSDPCLAANSDNESKDSGNNQNSSKNESTKMLSTILEQISVLHETNTKICRNLHENKVDIEALKHAPNWGLRHRRDSISGLSTHSQPMGYHMGNHSPAPTFHSGMYTPGALTDVVREVKEAARVREEALLSRVRAMVEERSWSVNDSNLKMVRDLEDMKVQVSQLKSERKDTNATVTKMEDEIKSLRALLSHVLNTISTTSARPSVAYHPLQPASSFNERDFSRSPMSSSQHQHRQQRPPSLNLSYGIINQDDALGFAAENELIKPMNQQFNDIRKAEKLRYSQNNGKLEVATRRNSNEYTESDDQHGDRIVQMEKDELDLRQELQHAIASKKQAENKILALENMVKKLQNSSIHVGGSNGATTGSAVDSVAANYFTNPSGGPSTSSRNSSVSESHPSYTPAKHLSGGVSPKIVTASSSGGNTICLTGPVTDL